MIDDGGCQVTEGACGKCSSTALAIAGPCSRCGDGVLQEALYGLPLVSLQLLRRTLRSTAPRDLAAAVAPISPRLADWVALTDDAADATLSTIVDVLLTLYVIAEETAPPDQLDDVVVGVLGGHLDRLPLPPRGPCFCGSAKRYRKCHGQPTT